MLKDQKNKKAHAMSAHLACEAAGSIRTVAALTREDDCCEQYSQSLEEPLRESNRTSIWSSLLFATSQACSLFVIALIFWYGSFLVSHMEFTPFQFFIGLMVRITRLLNCRLSFKQRACPEHDLWRYSGWEYIFLCSRHIVRQRGRS